MKNVTLETRTASHVTLDETLHRSLAMFNARRLAPRGPEREWTESLNHEVVMRKLEHDFLEKEQAGVQHLLPDFPCEPKTFLAWFANLKECGPGQHDALFPWLSEKATLDEMTWFILQEAAGEAGFDDLIALTQVKLPVRAKIELARNYWDEMGRGQVNGMHGGLLARLVRKLDLTPNIESTVWPALALGNLMVALATDRHYAFHSLGALGVIELTAPSRVSLVNEGLRRLGIAQADRLYFELHATLDVKHAQTWLAEVLSPLVHEHPEAMPWLAEGALLRLNAGARCFARYRAELGVCAAITS